MAHEDQVNILIVDDKPEKLLALEAVLEDLGENLVRASSGRDALRHLLQREFAVILLDVNMPAMDGFETASLIRQRRSSEHVPIIFVTAMGDDTHATRGYSLGAVDYIQTPVVPDVLRTKVSVFVDLFRKTEQVRRQAAWLRQRATQLHKLTAASMAINSALSMEETIRIVTETARQIIAAHQAFTTVILDHDPAHARTTASLSEKYAEGSASPRRLGDGSMAGLVCRTNTPMRMTRQELAMHPAWGAEKTTGGQMPEWKPVPAGKPVPSGKPETRNPKPESNPNDQSPNLGIRHSGFGIDSDFGFPASDFPAGFPASDFPGGLPASGLHPGNPSLVGWLAAPLSGRDGRNIGLIEVSEKLEGDFTGEDEAILVQLAQMASIAIENTIYAEEREANRLKDEFLWTLSHELRTPLNAILGWTQLLRLEELSGEAAHGMRVIERNAQAQTKLIEDLLDISRITMGKLRLNVRPMRLGPVIEGVAEALRPAAEAKRIRIDLSLTASDSLTGDPDRLGQVVWNLLSNAVKFTPEGGRVEVCLERVEGSGFSVPGSETESSLNPEPRTLNPVLQFSVADSGQGINPAFLPYVFDRFRQADSTTTRAHGGLGIGLTIARHIVELHGATIHAQSDGEGRGSTFCVILPSNVVAMALRGTEGQRDRGTEGADPSSLRPSVASSLDLEGIHVLLVDDEADTRDVIGQMLRKLKAQVTEADCAADALELLPRCRPDVLVSDIAMPQQDGHELIRRVRALTPERGAKTPAIALTAYAREDDRVRSLEAGYQLHLVKPIDASQLVAAISQLAAPGEGTKALMGKARRH